MIITDSIKITHVIRELLIVLLSLFCVKVATLIIYSGKLFITISRNITCRVYSSYMSSSTNISYIISRNITSYIRCLDTATTNFVTHNIIMADWVFFSVNKKYTNRNKHCTTKKSVLMDVG